MNCLEAEPLLRAHIDAEESAAAVASHMESCRLCREKSARLRGLIAELRAQPRPETSDEFLDRLHERLEPATAARPLRFMPRLTWKVALSFGLAAACAPQAYDALSKAFRLNRTGQWSEAAKVASDAADRSGASLEERCGAIVSAAYSHARLDEGTKARSFAKRFGKECAAVPADSWMRRELDQVQAEYTAGTTGWLLKRAMRLNQNGDWPLARAAAVDALKIPTIDARERCEAYYHEAYALTRMGERDAAALAMKSYDARCQGVPKGYWTHREMARLKAERTGPPR